MPRVHVIIMDEDNTVLDQMIVRPFRQDVETNNHLSNEIREVLEFKFEIYEN